MAILDSEQLKSSIETIERKERAPVQPSPLRQPAASPVAPERFLLWGAFFISLAAAAVAGFLYYDLNREAGEASQFEAQRIQLEEQVQSLQEQIHVYQENNLQLTRDRDTAMAIAERRLEALEAGKARVQELEKNNLILEEELNTVQSSYQELKQEIDDRAFNMTQAVTGPVQVATDSVRAVTSPVRRLLPGGRSDSEREESAVQSPRAAGQIGLSNQLPQVMTVNREFGFVVVNVGKDDNLRVGSRLEVRRDGDTIAQVEVQKIYDRFASARILNESRQSPLRKGDRVKRIA